MSKYLTIVRNAALPISDDFLKRAVSNHRHATGVAAIDSGQIKVAAVPKPPTVDGLKTIIDQFADSTVVFSLSDVKNLPAEDIMPFTILKDKSSGQPLVILCLDGAFDRHRVANTAHSGEYHVAYGLIAKKVQRWFDAGGIENVKKELDDEMNQQDFANMWSNKGCATFLFADGTAKTVHNYDDNSRQMSWGFVSDPYGFKEEQPKPKEEPKPKEDNLLSMLTSKLNGKKTEVEHKPAEPPKTETAIPSTSTHSVTGLPVGAVVERPEKGLDRRPLKIWYEQRLGHAPHGFRSEPPLIKLVDGSYKLADSKSLASLGTMVSSNGNGTEHPKEVPPQQSKTSNTEPQHVSTSNKEVKVVRSSQVPILEPKTVERWQTALKKEEFKGFFDENLRQILDPKSIITSIERAAPTFTERLGWGSIDMTDRLSYEQWQILATSVLQSGNPRDTMAKIFSDLSNHALKYKLANPNAKWTPEKVAM